MQKSKLDKFIQKYNLGGNVNSVKWKSSGDSISTSFVTPDKSLLGSVKVDKLFDIETFANVHHLVSTIHAEIDSESNIYNLIRDAFPGGSITGAPKLRAMQIIHELEPNNRSIYCGSIGYISFDEKTDFNISIRSMLSIDNNLYFWGGGGIVNDSDIRSEYNETISKVKPLLDTFSD